MYNSTGTEILISYNDEDLYVYNTKTGEGFYDNDPLAKSFLIGISL